MASSETIYEHARACEAAFSLITLDQKAPSYIVAETLRQRFEQWSSNMGVFAVMRFSLDARLAHSDSLRSMVLDLLELMKTGLDRVVEVRVDDEAGETQESIVEQMRVNEAPDAILRKMLSSKAQDAGGKQMSASEMQEALIKQMTRNQGIIASVLVESLRTLKSVVDSLDRLGSAIRQSSSAERLTERIQNYIKKSNGGGVMEDIIYFRLKLMLVDGRKYKDGEMPDNARGATLLLCRQLAVSVAYRYFAIMYRRHHEQKRVVRREDKPEGLQKETHKDAAQRQAVARHEKNPHLLDPTKRLSAIPTHLRPAPSQRTESMLSRPESAVAKKKYASSQASFVGARSGVSIQPDNVTLPKPPTIVAPAVDAACPYCLVRFHKDEYAKQHWWERHIQSDLKLYTCISEDCGQPPLLFASYAEWKKHMDDTHTPQWTMKVHSPASWWCDLDHDEAWFSKEEDYESHMLAHHADKIEGYDMDDMKELATAKQPRTWDTCPICNCIPPTIKINSTNARGISTEERQEWREELLKHIGQHLKEIGLLSIDYLDDNDEGGSEASRNAPAASLQSRNYVPKAETVDDAWVFDDTGLADYIDVDYKSSDLFLTGTETSNLPEWQVLWKADLLDEEQTLRDHIDFAEKWRSPLEVAHCRKALESWLCLFAEKADNVVGNRFGGWTTYHLSPEDTACLQDLLLTDPRDDRTQIANDGFLQDAYRWIMNNDSYRAAWLNNLGLSLARRFERTGSMDDLNRAVEAVARAVDATPQDDPDRASRLNNLGSWLGRRFERTGLMGDLDRAVEAATEAVDATPQDHADRATRLSNLMSWLGRRFERTGLMDDLNRAVEAATKSVDATPQDDHDQAGRLGDLGSWLVRRFERTGLIDNLNRAVEAAKAHRRLPESEALLKWALQGYETTLGPYHQSTLDTVHNLGSLYKDQGRLPGAEAMYQRALQGYEKALGPDHPSTLAMAYHLGLLYSNQGRLPEAEAMYQRALQGHEKALGSDHLSTLGTVHDLGVLYSKQGRLPEAEATYQRALQGYEKALGPDHLSTLDIVYNLGLLYSDQSRLPEAESMYQRALKGYKKTLGPDHLLILETDHNLGLLYAQQDRLPEAEAMYQKALKGYEKTLGQDYPSTLAMAYHLGLLYSNQGRLPEAEAMYQRALQGYEKALGSDHLSTLGTVYNLGLLYSDQGRLLEAEAMYNRALHGYEKTLGPDHPSTLDTVYNLGLLYSDQGRLLGAEAMFQRALQGNENTLGPDHVSTLGTVNNFGLLYTKQGRLPEAEAMFQRVLQGYEKALGSDHLSTLDTANNLGLLYADQGRLPEAEAMFQRALQGYEKALGSDHLSTLATANNLGLLYSDHGRLSEAEATINESSRPKKSIKQIKELAIRFGTALKGIPNTIESEENKT